jgi:hypothetical protein
MTPNYYAAGGGPVGGDEFLGGAGRPPLMYALGGQMETVRP